MKRKALPGISGCFALLFFAASVWTAPLTDAMLSECHADATVCSWPVQGFYSQNGGSKSPSYTKLDDRDNALLEDASTWSMVRDNVTGLIWEMKTKKDGVKNYSDPHDADNTYSWFDSNPATNGGDAGTEGNGTDTEDFINELNKAGFGGYSDWRLPTLKELNSIVNYDIPSPGPAINTAYFPNTHSSFYWTSSASVGYDYRAWVVNFDDGYAHNYGKYGYYFVRAVRGGQAGIKGTVYLFGCLGLTCL